MKEQEAKRELRNTQKIAQTRTASKKNIFIFIFMCACTYIRIKKEN